MKLRIAALVTLATFTLGITGCATMSDEYQGAAKGAGIGAATGALAGALLAGEGSRTKGAILGGLAGALTGGVVGNYTADQKSTAAETANKYGYQPSTGIMLKVVSTLASPATVQPGGTVNLIAGYAVMSPTPSTPVAITESHEIRLNNELVGNPSVNVSHPAGTYSSNIPLTLPQNAKKGIYKVTTTISTASGKQSRETSFTVQ